jgi:glycosyltransferase involved in cell wall biosynthesis
MPMSTCKRQVKSQVHLLFLNSLYPPEHRGGAETSTALLCGALATAGHQVTVLCSGSETVDEWCGGVRVLRQSYQCGFDPFRPGTNRGLRKVSFWLQDSCAGLFQRRFSAELDDLRPDVVVTSNLPSLGPSIWKQASQRGLPIVHILRDYSLLCRDPSMMRGGRLCATSCAACWIYTGLYRLLNEKVTAVVGISRHVLEKHLANGMFRAAQHHEVIGNIVGRAHEIANPRGQSRIFGYLGRISPEKGILPLISAFTQVSRDNETLRLLIAGPAQDAEYASRVEEACAGMRDSIAHLGETEVQSFFTQIDCLVVPSEWEEPFGRVVVEAFSCGVPVIASNRGGLAETVRNGINGFTYDPSDGTALAEVLRNVSRLTEAEWQEIRTNAQNSARQFTPEAICARYQSLLERIVAD